MKTLHWLGTLSVILLLSSCSSPLDKDFDRETAESDFARIVRMGKIDSSEAYIMSHFMVEHELIGAQVLELDATYRDILEESKNFWEKSKEKREVTSENETVSTIRSSNDLKVTIQPFGDVQQSQWSHGIKYKLSIENTSGKAIKAIKGNFAFYDPFGDKVYSIEYKYLDTLETGEKVEREITLRLQNAASPLQVLEYGTTNPFTVKWELVSILF